MIDPVRQIIFRIGRIAVGDDLLHRLLRGGLASLLIKVWSAGLTFVMFMLLARVMTVAEYGVFSFAFSASVFMSVISGFGLQTAILKWRDAYEVGSSPEQARGVVLWGLRTTLLLSSALSLGTALIWCLARIGEQDPLIYVYLALLMVVPLAVTEYLSSALRSLNTVVVALLPKDVAWRLFACGLGLTALGFGIDLTALQVLAFLVITLAALGILQAAYLLRLVGPASPGAQTIQFATLSLLSHSRAMWIIAVLGAFAQNLDVVILGFFLTPEAVGPYFAAVKTANLLSLMLIASNMVSAPLISRYFRADDRVQLQRVLRLVSIGVAVPTLIAYVLLVLLGKTLLSWFGPGFASAYVPLLILGAGYCFNAICGPTGYLMQMTGHESAYLRIMSWTYTLVLPLQFVLIPLMGSTGAAIGSTFGFMIWNLWVRHYTIRHLCLDPTLFQLFGKPKS
jgi:O-antigen/teichoic acid export membrane protein